MKYPNAGDLSRELGVQLSGNPRSCSIVNPAQTPEEARELFLELIRDPDPAAMEIAQDLILEHKLSLADLSEGMSNTQYGPVGAVSQGIFWLSPFNPADAPMTTVFWWVEIGVSTRHGVSTRNKTFKPHIEWKFQVGQGGGEKGSLHLSGSYRTLAEARRSAAADSWAIAKALKRFGLDTYPRNAYEHNLVADVVAAAYAGGADTTPPEVYEHASTRTKPRTYAEAQQAIFDELRRDGWSISDRGLRLPYATTPNGYLRLWFKPQAVHATTMKSGHTQANARTISYDLDIRKMAPHEFLAYVQRRFPLGFR